MLLNMLDIQVPIFLAPMAGVSTPQLAATVSNQGGLGSLGLGASNVEQARTQILATKNLSDRPFQVNFFCHQPTSYHAPTADAWIDYLRPHFAKFGATPPTELKKIYQSFIENDDLLDVVLDTKPKAVSFHFGLPLPHQMQALKQANIITMVSVTNLIEAKLAQQAGIDILIVQGIEAGGHRGCFNPQCDAGLSTQQLYLLLKQHNINCPMVVAGGIMNATHIQHYLNLGANAVQLGTAFIPCLESAASHEYRHALQSAQYTQITDSISGRPARGILQTWQTDIDLPQRPNHAGYPYSYDLAKQLHQAASQVKNQDYAAFWAGANVAELKCFDHAEDLMKHLITNIQSA